MPFLQFLRASVSTRLHPNGHLSGRLVRRGTRQRPWCVLPDAPVGFSDVLVASFDQIHPRTPTGRQGSVRRPVRPGRSGALSLLLGSQTQLHLNCAPHGYRTSWKTNCSLPPLLGLNLNILAVQCLVGGKATSHPCGRAARCTAFLRHI